MKITLVEPQKKNPRRFNIFLDGVFAFGADEDTVVNRRLIVGKEVDSKELEKILFETQVGKLMDRMYRIFSIRERTEKEVRDYFKIKNFEFKAKEKEEVSDIVIDALIETLKRKGMLNDEIFAKKWVQSRRRSKLKGKGAIRSELLQKGINREVIDEVLGESEQEEESEASIAKQALEKKAKLWKNLPPLEFKKKAIEFLVRRGFDYSSAKEAVDSIEDNNL